MTFLIDEQLPPALATWLTMRGHAAIHVRDLRLTDATDGAIARIAEREGYVLLSKDDDFRRHRQPDRFALVWLRVGNASNSALQRWLEFRWAEIEHFLDSGERFIEVR